MPSNYVFVGRPTIKTSHKDRYDIMLDTSDRIRVEYSWLIVYRRRHFINHLLTYLLTYLLTWLVFNGTFSTTKLYGAIQILKFVKDLYLIS